MHSVFQKLYNEYHQDVFQFLFYLVKNRETAEDLMQEVYMKVLRSYGSFEHKSSEKTWLFSIARNAAIDHFRKEKNWKQRLMENFEWSRENIADEQALPDEIAQMNEDMQAVYRSLDLCSIDQRMVIILRYIKGLTIAETAAVLNWKTSKVKTTQHRALKAIRSILEENERGGR